MIGKLLFDFSFKIEIDFTAYHLLRNIFMAPFVAHSKQNNIYMYCQKVESKIFETVNAY